MPHAMEGENISTARTECVAAEISRINVDAQARVLVIVKRAERHLSRPMGRSAAVPV